MAYNIIPEILWIGPLLVSLILRPAVALAFVILAVRTQRQSSGASRTGAQWCAAGAYGILALLFALGLWVQYAALIGIVLTGALRTIHRFSPTLYRSSAEFYVLLFAALLSLFVTGAGPLSLDLPL